MVKVPKRKVVQHFNEDIGCTVQLQAYSQIKKSPTIVADPKPWK